MRGLCLCEMPYVGGVCVRVCVGQMLFGGMFSFLAKYSLGRQLLLAAPGIFTYGMFTHSGRGGGGGRPTHTPTYPAPAPITSHPQTDRQTDS